MSPASAGFIRIEISGSHEETAAINEAVRILSAEWPDTVDVTFRADGHSVTAIITLPRDAKWT